MRAPADQMTEAEYLVFELGSAEKHEFVNGRVYAMAGARPAHNAVCANIIYAIRS